jgi:proline iminopeptidase
MYPSIQPYYKTMFQVDVLKNNKKVEIYLECSGNKNGIPVIYLHGGPGDHVTPRHRRWYDPKHYHIILFDQRGSGQSKPLNHTEKNTTKLLIEDMEAIRKHLNINKWVVAGGSWGSSLALLYSQSHPAKVLAIILRGVYDLSQEDVLDSMYPEEKDKLYQLLDIHKEKDEQTKINKVLSNKTRKRRKLIQLMANEETMFVVSPTPKNLSFSDSETLTVIGNHYDSHHYFVPKNLIYKNMHKIKHIYTIMIEGRYDMVTPMKIAYKLSKLFDHCDLTVVKAGHSAMEENITKALVKKSKELFKMLS